MKECYACNPHFLSGLKCGKNVDSSWQTQKTCSINQDETHHMRLRLLHFSRYLGEASPCNTHWSGHPAQLEDVLTFQSGLDWTKIQNDSNDPKYINIFNIFNIFQSKSKCYHTSTYQACKEIKPKPVPCRKLHASSKPENQAR